MATKSGDKTKAAILADTAIDKVQWNKNLNFHALKAIKTACEFLPTTPSDWTSAPTTTDAALNELGSRSALGAETNSANVFTAVQTIDNELAVRFREATANGTNYIAVKAPASLGADYTLTLPAATDTLATLGMAETVTGLKTYSAANIHFATMTIVDAATNPKAIGFSTTGATASTKITLAAVQAGNITMTLPAHTCTLPATDGSAGQFIQTNGSGVWSFATAAFAEKTVTKTIASAALVAMNGATGGDVEVLAAQAGIVYIPTAIQIFADFNTAEYGAGDDCVVVLGTVASGTVVANIDKSAIIAGTNADAHTFMYPEEAIWGSSATAKGVIITGLANKPISFNVKSGGSQFTAGATNGDVKVKVFYREVALLT